MGCTEPIALAYGAAIARRVLGCLPERTGVIVSGNIIKNVKSVIVPHTGGMRGIEAAVAAGLVAGAAEDGLEVLSNISKEQVEDIRAYYESLELHNGNGCPVCQRYRLSAAHGRDQFLPKQRYIVLLQAFIHPYILPVSYGISCIHLDIFLPLL